MSPPESTLDRSRRGTPANAGLMRTFTLGVVLFCANREDASGLTIIRDFIGGVPGTNDTGTGNLPEIFNAAADVWEQVFRDEHVLTLHYGWAPTGGGEHQLNAQGGSPNRETEGTVLFNNDNVIGHHHYFLDPTPRQNEEFLHFTQIAQDMGGGVINVTRVFSGGSGDASSEDLFTVALHEIGHALGMSLANTSFIAASATGSIPITAPPDFVGTMVPLATNLFGVTSHIDYVADRVLLAGFGQGERILPSTLDILALAQLSGFQKMNYNLAPRQILSATATNLSITWRPLLPGYALEENTDLNLPDWRSVSASSASNNGLSSVNLPTTGAEKWFRLNLVTNLGLRVTASHDAMDANPNRAGVQVRAGTTVHYSGVITDSSPNPQSWQFSYTVNGGTGTLFQSGSGAVPTASFTFPLDSIGSTYVWTLFVISGPLTAQAHTTITVE